MTAILYLAPLTIFMGLIGLVAFLWTLKDNQYDDPQGDAARILYDHLEDGPGSKPN